MRNCISSLVSARPRSGEPRQVAHASVAADPGALPSVLANIPIGGVRNCAGMAKAAETGGGDGAVDGLASWRSSLCKQT
jgi:hypothetical protein